MPSIICELGKLALDAQDHELDEDQQGHKQSLKSESHIALGSLKLFSCHEFSNIQNSRTKIIQGKQLNPLELKSQVYGIASGKGRPMDELQDYNTLRASCGTYSIPIDTSKLCKLTDVEETVQPQYSGIEEEK